METLPIRLHRLFSSETNILTSGEKVTCKTLMNTNPDFELNKEAIELRDESLLAYQPNTIPM